MGATELMMRAKARTVDRVGDAHLGSGFGLATFPPGGVLQGE